jgi:hypothetical protein
MLAEGNKVAVSHHPVVLWLLVKGEFPPSGRTSAGSERKAWENPARKAHGA